MAMIAISAVGTSAVTSGANLYGSMSGQNGKQMFDSFSAWTARHFTIGGPSAAP